ncbi:hypothetical protein [Allorhodopirellula heiligendammensis]|uniref:Uncharacterized protein n=1 Tax=Allorhodopirellula heiligendammensis TaxID=2714739 RepID=A0A5C6BXB7_9BACT|nr:hypothetical protein [Allorhodopirellula heiligendammensis]TWU16960.1 hypothetical protein Poly21_41690 [Allorhodopirellula heiligendammensis]
MTGNFEFLAIVDRTAEQLQTLQKSLAVKDKAFEDSQAKLVNVVKEKSDENARVVFSTYPKMMNLVEDTKNDGQRRYGVGNFDLIIIYKARRSIYQKF